MSVLSSGDKSPSEFNIGDAVYVRLAKDDDDVTAIVETPPTSMSEFYTVRLETGNIQNVSPADVFFEEEACRDSQYVTRLLHHRMDEARLSSYPPP